MSLEDQYDAWVRGLMGGKKYAATSKQAEKANDAVQQMQASLDALTAAQSGRVRQARRWMLCKKRALPPPRACEK